MTRWPRPIGDKQYVIVACNVRLGQEFCRRHDPPLNPRDPEVVILTHRRDIYWHMEGRHFPESEIHVLCDGVLSLNELMPFFPNGMPEFHFGDDSRHRQVEESQERSASI